MLPAARDYAKARRRIETALAGPAGDPDQAITAFLDAAADVLGIKSSCWHDTDPASGLPVSSAALGDPPGSLEQSLRYEFGGRDVNAFHELATRRAAVGAISLATRGRLTDSHRFREMIEPEGAADELRVVFRDAYGTWATVVAFTGRRMTEADVGFVAAVQASVTEAIRAATAAALVHPPLAAGFDQPESNPAVLVLDAEDRVIAADSAARERLSLAPGRDAQLPGIVAFLAARARAKADEYPSTSRMRNSGGRWLTLHASALDDAPGSVAVIIEPAARESILDGVLRSLGLSARERQVALMCAQGRPSKAIAAELFLSPWTVQDHLKAIYAKTGLSSRAELTAFVADP